MEPRPKSRPDRRAASVYSARPGVQPALRRFCFSCNSSSSFIYLFFCSSFFFVFKTSAAHRLMQHTSLARWLRLCLGFVLFTDWLIHTGFWTCTRFARSRDLPAWAWLATWLVDRPAGWLTDRRQKAVNFRFCCFFSPLWRLRVSCFVLFCFIALFMHFLPARFLFTYSSDTLFSAHCVDLPAIHGVCCCFLFDRWIQKVSISILRGAVTRRYPL